MWLKNCKYFLERGLYRIMDLSVVSYLVISKNPEDMKLRIRSESLALSHAGNNPSNKGTMTQPWRKKARQTQIKEWLILVIWTIHLGWFSQLHLVCNNDWLNVFKPVSWQFYVSPSSSVFSLVQLVLSLTFLKWGCFSLSPVSNTATFTPEPANEHKQVRVSSQTWSPKAVESSFQQPII